MSLRRGFLEGAIEDVIRRDLADRARRVQTEARRQVGSRTSHPPEPLRVPSERVDQALALPAGCPPHDPESEYPYRCRVCGVSLPTF